MYNSVNKSLYSCSNIQIDGLLQYPTRPVQTQLEYILTTALSTIDVLNYRLLLPLLHQMTQQVSPRTYLLLRPQY